MVKQLLPEKWEMTINLKRLTAEQCWKRRAPRAIRQLKKFALGKFGTELLKVDLKLNKYIWSRGQVNLPRRVRVLFERKHNEDENSKHKMYTYASLLSVTSFKGLKNEKKE